MEESNENSASKQATKQTSLNLGANLSNLSSEENPYQTDSSQQNTAEKLDKEELQNNISKVCLTQRVASSQKSYNQTIFEETVEESLSYAPSQSLVRDSLVKNTEEDLAQKRAEIQKLIYELKNIKSFEQFR